MCKAAEEKKFDSIYIEAYCSLASTATITPKKMYRILLTCLATDPTKSARRTQNASPSKAFPQRVRSLCKTNAQKKVNNVGNFKTHGYARLNML